MESKRLPRTADEILRAALRKEEAAYGFYAGLASRCPVEFVRELLEKLRDEEARHVRLVKGMLGRLGAGRPLS